jgi:hypothetical protein
LCSTEVYLFLTIDKVAESNENNNIASKRLGEVLPPLHLVAFADAIRGGITLLWDAPEIWDAVWYEVYRSIYPGADYSQIGTTYIDPIFTETTVASPV